jgi:hypothetical protein
LRKCGGGEVSLSVFFVCKKIFVLYFIEKKIIFSTDLIEKNFKTRIKE